MSRKSTAPTNVLKTLGIICRVDSERDEEAELSGRETDRSGGQQRARPRHHGEVFDLFGIYIVNLLLTIVTLGVYRFWAKTRIRRFLWSQTEFLGDRFEYTGTAKELLIGFLIVLTFLVVALAAYTTIFTLIWPGWFDDEAMNAMFQTPIFLASVPLVAIARFRARRYRLSRSLWRGIRGAQTGSSLQYGLRDTAYSLLTLFTFGFYWPYMQTRLADYKFNNTWFGDQRVSFAANGDRLLGVYAVCWLLTVPTLGFCWIWYRAAAIRYYASCARYADLGFEVDIDGWSLFRLVVPNWLLRTFTAGLAYPYVLIRTTNFICERFAFVGDQDFALVAQSLKPRPTTGEGLAEAFDVGDF